MRGASLTRVCANCGALLSPTAKFVQSALIPLAKRPGRQHRASFVPEAYTPKHLAEKILTSKDSLEGERKQVTVLFADLKGSMELLADRPCPDRDPPRATSAVEQAG